MSGDWAPTTPDERDPFPRRFVGAQRLEGVDDIWDEPATPLLGTGAVGGNATASTCAPGVVGPEDYFDIDPIYRLWLWPADIREAVGKLNLSAVVKPASPTRARVDD